MSVGAGFKGLFGGGSGGSDSPAIARGIEDSRQAEIRAGVMNINRAFNTLGSDTSHQRTQDYINYAMPRLGEQTRKAQKNLTGGLNNRGLLHSSVASEKQAELAQLTADEQANIVDTGMNLGNDEKLASQRQQSTLIAQLIASMYPKQAQEGALAAASGIQVPNGAQNTMALFNNISNAYLAQQVADQADKRNYKYSYDPLLK